MMLEMVADNSYTRHLRSSLRSSHSLTLLPDAVTVPLEFVRVFGRVHGLQRDEEAAKHFPVDVGGHDVNIQALDDDVEVVDGNVEEPAKLGIANALRRARRVAEEEMFVTSETATVSVFNVW